MQIDFVRYTKIRVMILGVLIGLVFIINRDFKYELSSIFALMFILEVIFVWMFGGKK